MKNLLLVDDEAIIRTTLKRLLEGQQAEWRLNFATSAEEALTLLRTFDYDAVLTDFQMPDMNGIELLTMIRREPRTADVPVVVLTGCSDIDIKRRALDAGATDLLSKPVDRDDLIARIHSILRLKAYQDEIKAQNVILESKVRERTALLERARLELIWRLGKAGEFRDSETGHHVVRVGYFSLELARSLGLDKDTAERIFHSSPLHDIGKIGIPDNILLKPGRLDSREWTIMKRHTTIGASILQANFVELHRVSSTHNWGLESTSEGLNNPLVEVSAKIAHYHHEKWDGNGYPLGLKGEDIPIEARITTVADVYDALGSRRPYKESMPEEDVLSIMRRGMGTQFDPAVIDAFERCLPTLRDIRAEFSDDREELHPDILEPLMVLRD